MLQHHLTRAALALGSAALLATACQHADPIKERIDALPELPTALATQLDTLPGTTVLVTKGTVGIPDRPPLDTATVVLPALNCSSVKRYVGQILYPMTVCSPPPWSIIDIKEMALAEDIPGKPRPVNAHYRLRLNPAQNLFCHVTGGPWAAFIDEHLECNGAQWCRLEILGAPTYVSYTWSGSVSEAPEDPYLFNVESTGGVYRAPCGAHSTCGGGVPPPDHP
ncbi:MAG: hypothetical protein KA175_11125 [Flavobacteriales bacterium]|nr:hypothetical protein [Flavobacteriales bacterium]MBP6698163.1 hypothetical protein [Flavobacteriales bacterium]